MCIACDVRDAGAFGPRPFALPGAEPRYARDRQVKVHHIRLEVALDFSRRRIEGVCATRLSALNERLRRVTLDAVELEIRSVALHGGPRLAFTHDGEKLDIELPRELLSGEEVTLEVAYAGSPRRGLYFVGPDASYPRKHVQAWTQGQDEDARYWFPCYDYPNEKATSEVIATVPSAMYALSNGRLVETREDARAGTKTYHWSLSTPHVAYLVTLVAGEFDTEEAELGALPIQFLVPSGRKADIARSFGKTPAMIRHFEDVTGVAYPYEKYAQVCVGDFIFGGMENTSATTLTDATLHDEKAHEDQSSDSLVAHELAHQWFGDLLTCKDWSHGWLNEGFATFFEALWKEKDKGWEEYRYYISREAESYFEEDRSSYRRPIVTRVYKDPIEVFDRHLYEKGCCTLDMLRFVLGDAQFFRALRHYAKKHRGENVVTADLAKAVEEATGRNIEWFLDEWVFRGGHPELEVSYEWEDESSTAKVTVKQKQKEDDVTPLFRMPLDLGFKTASGEIRTERVELLAMKEQSFFVRLAAKPKTVRFDPGDRVLKKLTLKLGEDMLKELIATDPDPMLRVRAAWALADKASPAAVAALARALHEDAQWFVRAEAAKALGEVRGEVARDALLDALGPSRREGPASGREKYPKVRRAIAEALGEFREQDPPNGSGGPIAPALLRVLAGDVSYAVEGEAARSLGKIRSPLAFDAIVAALERPSQADILQQGCLGGLAELKDARGIEVCERFARYGAPALARASAVLALGKLGKEHHERRDRIRDALERLLDDPWFRVQSAAPKALETIADAAAIGALSRAKERALDGRVRRRAAEAIRKLEKGKEREDEVKQLRTDLDKIKEENLAMRDRLERLEKVVVPPKAEKT